MKNLIFIFCLFVAFSCANKTPQTQEIDNTIEPSVIDNGYGSTDRRKSTGAGNSVENDVTVRSLENYVKSLPGVSVVGDQITIHGFGTFVGSNEPLFVVDNQRFSGNFAQLKNLINPNDIKRVSVLTDAASLAIYGSQGFNGVIIITTKLASGKK